MQEIKNNKFDETLLSEESKQKLDQDLKQNGIKSIYLKPYLDTLKKLDPIKFEDNQKISIQELKDALRNKGDK
ncbi:nuclease PIN [Mycoplasmopsis adleri]|uniref:nuclease PIN n=1 Tax=Mycoplasmopsis adleri TaxID=51362 RepID=UPI00387354C2